MGRNFDPQEPIGRAIKDVRKLRGMKQGTLAERSGLDQASLSQIENRGWNLALPNLAQICAGLDVRFSELIAIADALDTVERVADRPDAPNMPERVPGRPDAFDSAEEVLDFRFLGRAIREAMALREISDDELTRRTTFTKRTVADAISGTGSSSIGTVLRIADVLETGRAELFARAEALQREAHGGAGDRSSA